MSTEASPRPWRVNSLTGGHICDANGDPVCFCVGSNCGERAALIVDAVNEHGRLAADEARYRTDNVRLRELVRRLADLSESLLANYEYRYREDPNSMEFVKNSRDFITEARKHTTQ